MRNKFVSAAGVAIVATLAGSGAAVAAQSQGSPNAASGNTEVVQGRQAFVDPATGRLRQPTDAERRLLREQSRMRVEPSSSANESPWPRNEAEAARTFVRNRQGSKAIAVPLSKMVEVAAEVDDDGVLHVREQQTGASKAEVQE